MLVEDVCGMTCARDRWRTCPNPPTNPIEAASAAQHVLAVCGCGLEVEVELKQHQAHAQALVHRLQSVVEVAPHQLMRARLHLLATPTKS